MNRKQIIVLLASIIAVMFSTAATVEARALVYTMKEGDNPWNVYEKSYGSPTLKEIEETILIPNNIKNPREIPIGTKLLLPIAGMKKSMLDYLQTPEQKQLKVINEKLDIVQRNIGAIENTLSVLVPPVQKIDAIAAETIETKNALEQTNTTLTNLNNFLTQENEAIKNQLRLASNWTYSLMAVIIVLLLAAVIISLAVLYKLKKSKEANHFAFHNVLEKLSRLETTAAVEKGCCDNLQKIIEQAEATVQ